MLNYPEIGLQIPQVYLPRPGTDLTRWSVIACDQFTSQPDYWDKVESMVGDAPSTLRLTLPEIHLEKSEISNKIADVQSTMRRYLDEGIVQPTDGLIYVERTVSGKTRKGLVVAIDLECYDYSKGSKSLIRATEGTIVDRLPPRMKIRENALLELPHILVLIDDPENSVIEPFSASKSRMESLYDFELMLGSGHLAGYKINQTSLEEKVISALRNLAQPALFSEKYGVPSTTPVLLYAMGDGNHSLATAKAIWEKIKSNVGMDHPARYALVEIENVHDEALEFKPIHRVLFGVKQDFRARLESAFSGDVYFTKLSDADEMTKQVDIGNSLNQKIGLVLGKGEFSLVEFSHPSSNLAVGTIQPFLDTFIMEGGAEKIDYVHGVDVTVRLGSQSGNLGIYLPGMHKNELFKTVILDGALPRKTFSMGEAHEKRFYMEARKIA
jgi:uncharacterized protein (DUF1015 family)